MSSLQLLFTVNPNEWFALCKAFVVAWVILRVLIDGPEKIVIDGQAGAGSP